MTIENPLPEAPSEGAPASATPPSEGPASPPDPAPADQTKTTWRVEHRIFKGESLPEGNLDPAAVETRTQLVLKNQITLIGRSSHKRHLYPDIACNGDDAVSHRHAHITLDPDGNAYLIDLGSTNGTMLNGKLIAQNTAFKLKDEDHITLGAKTILIMHAPTTS
jgi:pSer/pThr/pTyr-binding forkhead associated (FHA) protein